MVAVGADEFHREGTVRAGGVASGSGVEVRRERTWDARARRAVGTVIEGEELGRPLFGQCAVPRGEGAFDRVGATFGRRRQRSPLGPEYVEVEIGQRALRQVREGEGQATVCGSG